MSSMLHAFLYFLEHIRGDMRWGGGGSSRKY